mmetsp:Transcript_15225/g.31391  ORF Transcript_15225/g.31391 Transcript_15225/m.31391 type:complete len:356 (-) Transcript_15225:1671-2738(-)
MMSARQKKLSDRDKGSRFGYREIDRNDEKQRQTNISQFFLSMPSTAATKRTRVAPRKNLLMKEPLVIDQVMDESTKDPSSCQSQNDDAIWASSSQPRTSISQPPGDEAALALDSTKKRKRSSKETNPSQLFLDLGQKSFAKRTLCRICGMLFVHGVAQDKVTHEKTCLNFTKGVPFRHHIKASRVLTVPVVNSEHEKNCKIVEIRSSDSSTLRKKVEAVRSIAHNELGFVCDDLHIFRTTFLFVKDQRVIGMLAIEPVSVAFVLLPSTLERLSNPVPVSMGVHTIWVHSRCRGQKVASRLLDAARAKFLYGSSQLAIHQIAFSSPTQSGIDFATSYLRQNGKDGANPQLLIYESV